MFSGENFKQENILIQHTKGYKIYNKDAKSRS